MEKVTHRLFLEKNKIDTKLLLEPIQSKIKVFDKMYKLLDEITPCGKGSLLKQLRKLDVEIMDDIMDVYADDISNNEIMEIKKKHESKKAVDKVTQKEPKKGTDEFILFQLIEMGKTTKIGRSTLLELGLKTELEWLTVVGKYRIIRTNVFSYLYDISIVD